MKVATRSKIFYALLKVFASCGFGVFRSIIASCLIVERYILKWCSKHIAEILREVACCDVYFNEVGRLWSKSEQKRSDLIASHCAVGFSCEYASWKVKNWGHWPRQELADVMEPLAGSVFTGHYNEVTLIQVWKWDFFAINCRWGMVTCLNCSPVVTCYLTTCTVVKLLTVLPKVAHVELACLGLFELLSAFFASSTS